MSAATVTRRFVLDAILWFIAPTVFLTLYVHSYFFPIDVVLPHLQLIALPLLFVALIRIALSRIGANPSWQRAIIALLAASLLWIIFLYYALVIIGLSSWGQVVSWDLITSYAAQVPDLAESLDISLPLIIGLMCLIFASLWVGIWFYLRSFDWTTAFVGLVPSWLSLLLVHSGILLIGLSAFGFYWSGASAHSEPISLTIMPAHARRAMQSHAIDGDKTEVLDRKEDAARSSYVANAQADKKNIILIVVDALRPSHMGVYGYQRNTTPRLDQLLHTANVRIVSGARSSCGESVCGLYSLATSKYVNEFSMRPFTLYEALRKNGYGVQMIMGGDHTNFYGLKQLYGNNNYYDGADAKGYYFNDDQLVVDKTASLPSWDGKPLLIQYHLMSTHALGLRKNKPAKFEPAVSYLMPPNRGKQNAESNVNFYDNGVALTDTVIHELLTTLEQKGYLQNSLVVITADHGEGLGEHGLYTHANGVYDEIIRVPLLFIAYGYSPPPLQDPGAVAAQVDIAPTILAECGLARPTTWSGVSLQEATARDFTFFVQGFDTGLIDQRDPQNIWKYWHNGNTGAQFAFNLTRDPQETQNLASTVPVTLAKEWRAVLLKQRPVDIHHGPNNPKGT